MPKCPNHSSPNYNSFFSFSFLQFFLLFLCVQFVCCTDVGSRRPRARVRSMRLRSCSPCIRARRGSVDSSSRMSSCVCCRQSVLAHSTTPNKRCTILMPGPNGGGLSSSFRVSLLGADALGGAEAADAGPKLAGSISCASGGRRRPAGCRGGLGRDEPVAGPAAVGLARGVCGDGSISVRCCSECAAAANHRRPRPTARPHMAAPEVEREGSQGRTERMKNTGYGGRGSGAFGKGEQDGSGRWRRQKQSEKRVRKRTERFALRFCFLFLASWRRPLMPLRAMRTAGCTY